MHSTVGYGLIHPWIIGGLSLKGKSQGLTADGEVSYRHERD